MAQRKRQPDRYLYSITKSDGAALLPREGENMKIFRVYWREKTAPKEKLDYWGFVKAESEEDALRITNSMLDDQHEATEAHEAAEHMITPRSITLNFENKAEYLIGW